MLKNIKKCQSCGFPKIWSKNLCKNCYLKHFPSKSLKKGGKIAKYSEKGLIKKEAKKDLIKRDLAFYKEIWNERPHICFETGKYLGEEPLNTMFHHVLFKSNYPQYRYEKWNIVLLYPDVHNQVHTNIDKTPKVKEYMKQLSSKIDIDN